jgi:sugar lactone lactonase YvrE
MAWGSVARVVAAAAAVALLATGTAVAGPGAAVEAQEVEAPAGFGDGLKPGLIRYVAGIKDKAGFSGDGGPATEALLQQPYGVDFDAAGNLYIADYGSNGRVRRVDAATGVITTVAGGGPTTSHGDGGPATSAWLYHPHDVAIGPDGDLYIADSSNQRIRRVDAETGIISTFAGGGTPLYNSGGFAGDGGPAATARLWFPTAVDVAPNGDVYIADTNNGRIRKVDGATGIITTVAGTGRAAYSGDGGPATAADLYLPWGVAADADGNVFIGDTGNYRVRRVDAATGLISTYAGGGTLLADGNGGPATAAQVTRPRGLDVDDAGNLFIAEEGGNALRRVDAATGVIGTVGGGGLCTDDDCPAIRSTVSQPYGIAVGPGGLLATDAGQRIAVIAPDVQPEPVRNVAARYGAPGCCSPALIEVSWSLPATPLNRILLTASPGGATASATGTATAGYLTGLTQGEQYVATVRSFNGWYFSPPVSSSPVWFGPAPPPGNVAGLPAPPPGELAAVAGTGLFGFSGDGGPATQAQLAGATGIAWDSAGNLFVADTQNGRVRRVSASTGVITTVAGTGEPASSGDGGPALLAGLATPIDVAVAPDFDLWVLEFGSHRLRRIEADTGIITTVAGTGTPGSAGDGGPATSASLNRPRGITLLPDGAVVIADTDNHRIRRVDPVSGVITTIAGTGTCAAVADGVAATSAPVCSPYGVESDAIGNLYVGDASVSGVRRIDAATGVITTVARQTLDRDAVVAPLGDGLPAIENVDSFPYHLALDGSGHLFLPVRDRLRRVDAGTGLLGTVAGGGSLPAETASGPAVEVDLYVIRGVAVHPNGTVAVTTGDSVRVVSPDGPPAAPTGANAQAPAPETLEVSWTPPPEPTVAARVVVSPSGRTRHVERSELPGPVQVAGVPAGSSTATVAVFNGWGWSSPSEPSPPVDVDGEGTALFDQFDADAVGTAPVNAFLLNLLANAVYKETWDPDHSARTDESWRELMTQRAAEWGLTDLSFDITDTGTGTQSIAVRTADALIVSFRGTEPNETADVITDGGVALTPVVTPYGLVNVHAGFWGALDSVYPELLAMAQEVPADPVWLTGHSLGGSLAALAAFRLSLDGVTVGGVHTVGAPAVGDLALALVYDESLGLRDRTQRWVNDHDVVPMAFDLLSGYVDLGTTNVFLRTSLDDPRSFEYLLDWPFEPLTSPSLDEHDDALYATRIWELIRRTDPAAAAALPEPEPPYLRPTGTDTQRLVRYLVTYFTGQIDLLIAGLVEEAELAALEAAALMREAEATYTLIARVLYDGYQLTLDEIRVVLADLGATLEEIEEALAALVDELASLLNDGLAAVGATLAEWAAALGFSGDASLLPADLAALFGIDDLLAAVALPTFDPAATLQQIVDALPPGVTVDWAEGVVGTPPTAEDRFQARYVLTIDDLSSLTDPVSGSAAGVLDGLAESVGLTGSGSWDGSLTLSLVFGVDSVGFYLDPSSALVLDVDGSVAVATAADATVAGVAAPVSGTATADVTATVAPSGTARIRPGGIPEPTVTSTASTSAGTLGLTAGLTGTVATTLDATLGDAVLTWSGTWDVTAAAGTASATLRAGATLGGTATLTFLDDGGSPAAVSLTGVLEPEGWRIGGGLTGQLSAGGVTVTAATLDALLTPTTFSGHRHPRRRGDPGRHRDHPGPAGGGVGAHRHDRLDRDGAGRRDRRVARPLRRHHPDLHGHRHRHRDRPHTRARWADRAVPRPAAAHRRGAGRLAHHRWRAHLQRVPSHRPGGRRRGDRGAEPRHHPRPARERAERAARPAVGGGHRALARRRLGHLHRPAAARQRHVPRRGGAGRPGRHHRHPRHRRPAALRHHLGPHRLPRPVEPRPLRRHRGRDRRLLGLRRLALHADPHHRVPHGGAGQRRPAVRADRPGRLVLGRRHPPARRQPHHHRLRRPAGRAGHAGRHAHPRRLRGRRVPPQRRRHPRRLGRRRGLVGGGRRRSHR